MKTINGTGFKELADALEKFEKRVKERKMRVPKFRIAQISGVGNTAKWEITFNDGEEKRPKKLATGDGPTKLVKKLYQLCKEEELIDLSVYALISPNMADSVSSQWARLPVGDPYQIQKNRVSIELETLRFSRAVRPILEETGICLAEKVEGETYFYPVTRDGLKAFTRALSCESAFKHKDDVLGAAILVANRLASRKSASVRVIYRETGTNVRPILGIRSDKAVTVPERDFLDSVIAGSGYADSVNAAVNGAANVGMFSVSEWEITTDYTRVVIEIPCFNGEQRTIVAEDSFLGNRAMTVKHVAYLGSTAVIVDETTVRHDDPDGLKKIRNAAADNSGFLRFEESVEALKATSAENFLSAARDKKGPLKKVHTDMGDLRYQVFDATADYANAYEAIVAFSGQVSDDSMSQLRKDIYYKDLMGVVVEFSRKEDKSDVA